MFEVMMISFVFFGFIFFIMSLGYILNNKCITGSCGGLNLLFGKGSCEVCTKKNDCSDKIEQ